MSFVGLALFFAAWVGHSALWLVTLNLVYSQPFSRTFLRSWRIMVATLVAVFPFALAAAAGVDLPDFPPLQWTTGSAILGAYLGLCWLISLVIIPAVTVWRLLRRTPVHQLSAAQRIIDHGKPAGNGKYRRLSQLPFNQVFQVEYCTIELQVDGLPNEWDNLTILHLSDLHFCGTPDRSFFERVFDQCMADGVPDLIAVTGDFIDTQTHHRWILRLMKRLRWTENAFAICGNHDWLLDHERVRRRLERAGMTMLGNRWKVFEVRGLPMLVVGHEGPWFGPAPDLSQAPAGMFRLCLSHTPDNIGWAQENRVQLMLSGHCHGGQIRLPIFGSLFVPSKYSRRYDQGLFFEPPTLLYVNRGLSGKEPLRYGCRPEVTRIVLKAVDEPRP